MSELPEQWYVVKVGEIATLQSGFASGDHNRTGSGVPHLRPMNVTRDGRISLADVRYVTESHELRLERGDVLFNNTNSPELVGKTAYVDLDDDLAFSNHMTRIRVADGVLPQFVAHQLHHIWRSGAFRLMCKNHVSQASISTKTLASEVNLCLPPLAEQKRIVAKIEELTARSRRAKAELDAIPALLDQLRQSILAAAFRGDLTADWRAGHPNVEPASALLERVRAERLERGRGQPKADTVDLGKEESGYKIPLGWSRSSLGDICDIGTGATPKRGEPRYWEQGSIPWITSSAVNEQLVVTPSEYVTQTALDETNLTIYPPGTLLMAMYGEGQTRGRCAELAISATTNQALAALETSLLPNVLRDLVKMSLWAFYDEIRKGASGGVQPNLNLGIIKRIHIPIPPLEEQTVIVERCRAALSRISQVRAESSDSRAQLETLEQSILAKAFRGELVPQDPNDEPASVLLERIRAARSVPTSKPPKTRRPRAAQPVADASAEAPTAAAGPASAPAKPSRPASLDAEALASAIRDAIAQTLWQGPLEKDVAIRKVAEQLREAGLVEFRRLRSGGPLHAQIDAALEAGVAAGELERPRFGYLRLCKPDATQYTIEDWRAVLLASLGAEATEREAAIRDAAGWARDNLGLAFVRLRSDGHIVEGLRSAINSAIRRGEVVRVDAKHIARATQ